MQDTKKLEKLFQEKFNEEVKEIISLKGDGSDRALFRFKNDNRSVIGVIGKNKKENKAFVEFSRVFRKNDINVPEIYTEDLDNNIYLEEDLGDETLYSWMSKIREREGFSEQIIAMYKRVIAKLPCIQIKAGQNIDYDLCYQHIEFGKESMMWDMHYFKWNFLNIFYKGEIKNEKLEKEFNLLADFLLEEPCEYFLFRDFQSRNIMIKNEELYFIDYQSGRRGALGYDIASLLYDAKANIPQNIRENLLEEYINNIKKHISFDEEKFKKHFYGFALVRIMQALGAYGFLGSVKNKPHFLGNIPFAVANLEIILEKFWYLSDLPELHALLLNLCRDGSLRVIKSQLDLVVKIYSFGYHFSGIPQDEKEEHNGGFVFDLRALPNPGREETLRNLTGQDKLVKEFLDNDKRTQKYIQHIFGLVDMAIDNYQKRGFTDLMVSFGCTGGVHRSVYFAEKLRDYLEDKKVNVNLKHVDLDK
ncbi:MAG: RNase adapter RapZ [Patescibacteria group bacterium]